MIRLSRAPSSGAKRSFCGFGRSRLAGCYFGGQYINHTEALEWEQTTSHSTDGWAFGNNVEIKRHRTLGDRLVAAQTLVDLEPGCPVVVDDMSDVTACKYGSLPERLYVLQAGKVVYKGSKGPWGYYPSEVRTFLEKMN
ncbi:unnamed protein product [Boreogadus saida]